MEDISKALEKAQKEHPKNQDNNHIPVKDQPVQPPGPIKPQPQPQKPDIEPTLPKESDHQKSTVIKAREDILRDNRLMSYFGSSFISDQYKIIKTKILEKTKNEGLNTILVTSAFKGEGKSLTAANLAISLAKEVANTVLLVDADLRNPSLHSLFGISPQAGLSDYLLHDVPLQELFIRPGIDKFLFLPGHTSIDNSSEVVSSPRMENLVKGMKGRYSDRYVIFDAPPVIESSDSLILSKYVDGVILVVEAGKTQKTEIKKAIMLLENRNLIGLVLNKGEIPEKRYYRYY
ncbi:MAG: polysaccharide biosynthesis tyrosine autokinase [Thermodesulfobacteriota bacterium]|nr:polysaccharide biosynthesis tyrosine autokinase [Thermodesulfobacteriota bacterium]